MPTTFANTISLDGGTTNLPIYADRSEKDAAGNDIQTTYATKSEIVNADWDAVSGTPGYIENKPVIPEGVPTYTAAEEGKVLGVVEVSGSPALDWVQGGGGDSTLPSYYDRVEQTTLDGSMASIVLGPMLTRQTQTNTFNQRALSYTTLNDILLYGRGYRGDLLMDFVDRGYVHLSRSRIWADNPTYAIWFPCTADWNNILTPINTSVYLKTKSTYNWSYAGNYSHDVYTSKGSALTWSLARDARFPAPFSATGEIDTTLFDQVGDWSNITMPQSWQWALAFQDSDGNFTNCGGNSSENDTLLSVAYPVSYYNVKLMLDGGLAENCGAGLYVTNPLPSSTSSDENKVLTVNSSGNAEWATPSGGGSVTDVEVNGTSVVNASGVAEVTVPAQVQPDWDATSGLGEILNKPTIPSGVQLVPAATSADADKVLTVNAQGTPAWASAQAPISAGDGIDITNNVVSAKVDGTTIDTNASGELTVIGGGGGGSYTAGTGIDITNDVISVDTSVVATQTDLADKEDAFTVGTGLEMDTTGGVNTLQVETPMDIVAGPGIAIDNPDSDTLRVSVGTTFTQAQLDYLKRALGLDETVLYSGLKSNPDTGAATYQLSESPLNFQLIKLYCCASDNSFDSSSATGNQGVLIVEWDTTVYLPYNTFIPQLMNGNAGTNFSQYWTPANISGIRTTTWTVQGSLNTATSNAKWFHIYKIVGIHRIANN